MNRFRSISAVLIGAGFLSAGAAHFLHAPVYERIVPPWLPAPAALVAVSGAFEILGGAGVLIPVTRRAAGIGLIALLVAVFPANVQMATHPHAYADIAPPVALYLRLPLQAVLIAWVYVTCLGKHS